MIQKSLTKMSGFFSQKNAALNFTSEWHQVYSLISRFGRQVFPSSYDVRQLFQV